VEDGLHEIAQKENYLKAALKTSQYIIQNNPKCKSVANTFRFDNDGGITYYTSLYTGGEFYSTADYAAAKIVNKVGSGDCFMAGLIYGFYNEITPAETLEFATAAAFDKLFLEADATSRSVAEIKNTMIK